jgi:glycine oxidase
MASAPVVADLVVVGGGLIGLATSVAAAERGLSVALLTTDRPGAASRAGAGLLVPSHRAERVPDAVAHFMTTARDLYPTYVTWVEEHSGVQVPFDAAGALELARSPAECSALYDAAPPSAVRLTRADVADLEPALALTAGGILYPRDGAVDNVRLTDALASIVARHPRVRTVSDAAVRIELADTSAVAVAASGTRLHAGRVVLAAGAWAGRIDGLPRRIPVRPLRGQICTIGRAPLRHVVLGPDAYLVSRHGDRTLIGSTMEDVGFAVGTTTAVDALRNAAVATCPVLGGEPTLESWSGLRPATPDLLPILGADPDHRTLIYACGHSRNGILLTPITAAVTSAIAAGERVRWDVSAFSIKRFEAPR